MHQNLSSIHYEYQAIAQKQQEEQLRDTETFHDKIIPWYIR